jgi:hypothetical protein
VFSEGILAGYTPTGFDWKVCALLFCVLNIDVNVNHIMQWQLRQMTPKLPALDALELADCLECVPFFFLHQTITTHQF